MAKRQNNDEDRFIVLITCVRYAACVVPTRLNVWTLDLGHTIPRHQIEASSSQI
ncbi:hypothetical protein H633G_11069 [Metarhizium anisopliae BRIP 53284]|nr:hypothetical protein H633G_11069 [Metarhizium anisopliae BRIP 53284]